MTKLGRRLIDAAKEAVSIVRGEKIGPMLKVEPIFTFPDHPIIPTKEAIFDDSELCTHEKLIVVNFSRMWGDGEVRCKNCNKFIRYCDSG